jgi:HSP20 family protein
MTTLTRWEPFREMRRLHDLLDRSMDDAWLRQGRVESDLEGPAPIDVYETQNDVVVKAVMPGVKADEINISVDRDVLTLRGETKSEVEEKDDERNYHFREIRYSRYGRSLRLPTLVDSDKAKAEFEDGILTLTLPKAEAVKPRTISVKSK